MTAERRWLLAPLVLAAFALGWAWIMAQSVPRSDDLAYLEWAAKSPSVGSVWTSPPPFPGSRPLNALAWWLGWRWSGNGAGSVKEPPPAHR